MGTLHDSQIPIIRKLSTKEEPVNQPIPVTHKPKSRLTRLYEFFEKNPAYVVLAFLAFVAVGAGIINLITWIF